MVALTILERHSVNGHSVWVTEPGPMRATDPGLTELREMMPPGEDTSEPWHMEK